jgi:phage terminase large subunit-like protein
LDYANLTNEQLIALLGTVEQENVLLQWWSQCYGSPDNPKTSEDGKPYPTWQREFYDAGAFATQRLVMAANGVGKSQSVCAELAAHVTGEYPDWWIGKRFTEGGWEAWIGSIDNDMQKRGPQRALLGRDLEDLLGSGLIPKAKIKKVRRRQAGVKDVADTVTIEHASGRDVVIKFLTFEQGWRKWQSGDPKIILWDEEPDDSVSDQKDILSEALTRLVRNSGIFICGYTPLLGDTQLTEHFMNSEDPSVWWIGASWDDAPHMDADDRKRIAAQYPEHQRAARTQGVPMLGEGRIFMTPESEIVIQPVTIPPHWARVKGIDLGISHPAAVADLAWDRDNDVVYLTWVWRKSNASTIEHAHAINARDEWVPVAWPHDGMVRDPRSMQEFHKIYRNEHHVKMLSKSARYTNDVGGAQAQWPIIEQLNMRIAAGKFKVFVTCQQFLEEYRSYHTKDGKIVAKRDDVLKATLYALMMLRYAQSPMQAERGPQQTIGAFTTAVH